MGSKRQSAIPKLGSDAFILRRKRVTISCEPAQDCRLTNAGLRKNRGRRGIHSALWVWTLSNSFIEGPSRRRTCPNFVYYHIFLRFLFLWFAATASRTRHEDNIITNPNACKWMNGSVPWRDKACQLPSAPSPQKSALTKIIAILPTLKSGKESNVVIFHSIQFQVIIHHQTIFLKYNKLI